MLRIAQYLPSQVQNALFGDRQKHGLSAQATDPDWRKWCALESKFYDATQRRSAGSIVSASGYRVMRHIDLSGKTVLEIGPGNIDHISEWRGKPDLFYALDIDGDLLARSVETLERHGIKHNGIITEPNARFLLRDNAVDFVLSFYSLEHLHPLSEYLSEIVRVLKPGGSLVGAIPCEGGIGWGLGRYLTTRRWLLANGISDPGKIISWEHPNFADQIIREINTRFERKHSGMWPTHLPVIDLNLVHTFIMAKALT